MIKKTRYKNCASSWSTYIHIVGVQVREVDKDININIEMCYISKTVHTH